ncbi:MAG: AAA family ATPase, partial [Bacteroidaceae bacterium]|nr:AAA family ATPase [Bacteroidaceae bacterium]
MFKNAKSIHIEGGCYNEGVDLQNILSQHLNIVYGRNGSGKSSLATAIYNYANDTQDAKFTLSFSPELPDEARSRMFVFNEDFVINNVKLAEDGLTQFAMIGEQVRQSNQEDTLKEEETRLRAELEECNTLLEEKTKLAEGLKDQLQKGIRGGYAAREKEF